MASAKPDLWLSSQPKLVLIVPTHGPRRDGEAELTWVAGYIPSLEVSRLDALYKSTLPLPYCVTMHIISLSE